MSDYTTLSKVLHGLALSSSLVGETSFEVEDAIFGRKDSAGDTTGDHVFVAGLARSGTTALMRSLFETGEFCSLTYRDMPFVLAPSLWSRISSVSKQERAAVERAHGDNIKVDFDSPEALEEVFWRVFLRSGYVKEKCLASIEIDHEVIAKFRKYVALILRRYESSRYLSKNNNNVLRVHTLIEAFPRCRILCPIRDPAQQAYSLLKQHQKFKGKQAEDPFVRRYMGWLVHYEFGLDQRPFEWGLSAKCDPASIDYWVEQWTALYSQMLAEIDRYPSRVLPVVYERLCGDGGKTYKGILERLDIHADLQPSFELRAADIPVEVSGGLRTKAMEVYDQFCARMQAA